MAYLNETPFNTDDPISYYTVEITDKGLTVYSECCADTMSPETARLVRDGLAAYLANREAR